MATPMKKVIHWRCANCGRTADSSVKPGPTYGGKCQNSKVGHQGRRVHRRKLR